MKPDVPISSSEVTPPEVYYNRRQIIKAAAAIGTVGATAALYRTFSGQPSSAPQTAELAGIVKVSDTTSSSDQGFVVDEPLTAEEKIINYNNFYEFTTSKEGVAYAARNFRTEGWEVAVAGLIAKPRVFSMSDLLSLGPVEERIYRMRCVEAWSMVIPWAGIPFARLLEAVEPLPAAKFVAMETLYDPVRMPGQKTDVLDWPYIEGLRLDEAMHPLTLLATGLYGRELPPQDGAPVRLVTPWKYGFKGIKSIVKISLVDEMPPTSWNRYSADEYGFYANVNPNVDHPRWSQATEQRVGESGRRKTLMFNGYEEQVAEMYADLDLTINF